MNPMNNRIPVVALERIPRLEVPGNRTAFFDAREFENGHNDNPNKEFSRPGSRTSTDSRNFKALQSDDELSDSFEDFPVVRGLNIPARKELATVSAEDYRNSFAEIFNNQIKITEEIATIEQHRIMLDTMINAPTGEGPSDVLESVLGLDGVSWLHQNREIGKDNWMLPSENLIEEHPGEKILNSAERGKLFTRKQLTFKNMKNPVTSIDTMLHGLSCEMLDEVIISRSFTLFFPRLTDKTAALRLLFRLMSIHDDHSVMIKCKELLMSLLKTNPTHAGEAFGLKEVLEVLVNSGISLQKLIPVPELLATAERIVVIKAPDEAQEVEAMAGETSLEHNLECMLHILQYLISHGVSMALLEPDHLTILVVGLSTLALDTTLKTSVVLVKIRELIDDLLLRFSADEWAVRASCLARYLSSLSEIPQNMAFVSQIFCFSERGHHLQRLTSFIMLHKLLGLDSPTDVDDVMPHCVLSLVKSLPMRTYEDLCILYNVLVLINLCVSQNDHPDSWKVLQELASAVKKIENRLKNDCNAMDRIKVHSLATNIHLKWTILANAQPKSQKLLFEDSDMNDGLNS